MIAWHDFSLDRLAAAPERWASLHEWRASAHAAWSKAEPVTLFAWFAAALLLGDRVCACMTGCEGLLSGLAAGGLAHAGDAGLLAVWAIGHCDSMDGPVVMQAKKALESGNVNLVLPWVRAEDEAEIRSAFDETLAVRKLGARAGRLADMHFLETLVRVHRAGEGAPFRGIKPAGLDLGPAIPAADRALADGSIEALLKLLNDTIRKGVHEHYHAALHRRGYDPDDVAAAREYVQAYVAYIHYVEGLWRAATASAHEHAGHGAHAHEHG